MKTYAILNTLTENTLSNALQNIYNALGNHVVPSSINKADKFILFEKTIEDTGREYFSNAWTSNDVESLRNKAHKNFSKLWDYTKTIATAN
jgi:hypothetical protein